MLYDISYNNLLLYCATLPSYDPEKAKARGKGGRDDGEVIKADDPGNREKLRQFINLET